MAVLFPTLMLCSRRPEDDERAAEEQVLHHAEALHGRHAAHLHQLPRVQPARERVLQVCQPTGEVLLHQDQGGGPHREVTEDPYPSANQETQTGSTGSLL